MILSGPAAVKRSSRGIGRLAAGLLFLAVILSFSPPAHALAPPHHLYNFSRRLVEVIGAPFYAIFYRGPQRMKQGYQEEMWGAEKPKQRGKPIRLFKAVPRAVGEEIKATVDGVTGSIASGGEAVKELTCIFFGD